MSRTSDRPLNRPARLKRRGMALLLVMVGLVVCTILTAGFLSTQGTSIGIAKNERDAQKCRILSQTGIDMCYWLIKNKSDWRRTMPIGKWLDALPVGDGVVSVTAADGDGSSSFSDDPTQPVVLSSTGTYDGRSFSLTATVRPTGGGTVFYNGNFINGTISLGNGDLLTAATIDSYNSSIAPYNSLFPGSNANFASNSLLNNALTVYFPSVFRGAYTGNPNAILGNVINLLGLGVSGPISTSVAAETRIPGAVIPPNTAGLAACGPFTKTAANPAPNNLPGPGRYDSFSLNGTTATIAADGLYYFTGNFNVANASATLTVKDGVTAAILVDGNFAILGKVTLGPTSRLAIYYNNGNTATLSGSSVNLNGDTSHFVLYGTSACTQIQLVSETLYGSIYAPQATVTLKTGSPKLYGAIVANNLILQNSAQLHFDEALRALQVSNLTGGSASPGTPDYRLTMTGGKGLSN